MVEILTDTSIFIDYARRRKKVDKLATTFTKVFKETKNIAAISLVTVSELWAGKSMKIPSKSRLIRAMISDCRILIPDVPIAKHAGRILRDTNHGLSLADAYIAATALEHKLPVLTLNTKHFEKVKDLELWKPLQ